MILQSCGARFVRKFVSAVIILFCLVHCCASPITLQAATTNARPSLLDNRKDLSISKKSVDKTTEYSVKESNTVGKLIKSIFVTGNARIASGAIVAYSKLQIGRKYDNKALDNAMKSVYGSGFFKDVRFNYNATSGKLGIVVAENPTVGQVAFEGNEELSDKELTSVIQLRPAAVYSLAVVDKDVKTLVAFYQHVGFFAVKVTPKIVKKHSNCVDVIYVINENKKTKVNKITFLGNKAVGAVDLRKVIYTKERSWFHIFTKRGLYDREAINMDVSSLEQFYRSSGYADFHVVNVLSEFSPKKDAFAITFVLHEGSKYKVGKVTIDIGKSLYGINQDVVQKLLYTVSDSVYNQSLLDIDVEQVKRYLGKMGYAFAYVNYSIEKDKKQCVANITFTIHEGAKFYVNKINIKDNVRTLDRVIRREMKLDEGDSFDHDLLTASKRAIENLGYFSDVKVGINETNVSDKVDLDVTVKEKPTGSLNIVGGYDTSSGIVVSFSASENNLLGTGNMASFGIKKDRDKLDVSLGFAKPYVDDRNLLIGGDVFFFDEVLRSPHHPSSTPINQPTPSPSPSDCCSVRKYGEPDSSTVEDVSVDQHPLNTPNTQDDAESDKTFHRKSVGGAVYAVYPWTPFLKHQVQYALKHENVSTYAASSSPLLQSAAGKYFVSTISQSFIYDKRNSVFSPSDGYYLRFLQDIDGLGGRVKNLKNILDAVYYYPIYKNIVVFQLNGSIGAIVGFGGDIVRLNRNFYMGMEEMRGFDVQGIGPRDRVTGDAIGGKYYYRLSTEVSFPLGFPEEFGIKGAAFLDVGSLFGVDITEDLKKQYPHPVCPIVSDKRENGDAAEDCLYYGGHKLRSSYGFSVLWDSPLGSVFRLDYGWVMSKAPFDSPMRIKFSVSQQF